MDNFDVRSGTFRAGADASATTLAASRIARPAGIAGGPATAAPPPAATSAPSDAGVTIYNFSNYLGALQESVNSNKTLEKKARQVLADKDADAPAKQQAQSDLQRVAKAEETQKLAVQSAVRQVEDPQFIRGFGSNGGEEFLSYMNIGETLVFKGGEEWKKWDKSITENMNRIQNQDGSWSGDHCITGRTFCTGAALLVLMSDRTPIPESVKAQSQK